MNVPINSDSQLYASPEAGKAPAASGYSPSVPISVYRELATELKTTQTTLDALTQQNQQLLRQNTLLRNEIQRFVQAAEQLGHFAGVVPSEPAPSPQDMFTQVSVPAAPPQPEFFAPPPADVLQTPAETTFHLSVEDSAPTQVDRSADRLPPKQKRSRPEDSAIVPHPKKKRDRPKPPKSDLNQQRLFTEQTEGIRPLSHVAGSRPDLGNLWLATTILLVVVSAFGAGFLIMRPLLNR